MKSGINLSDTGPAMNSEDLRFFEAVARLGAMNRAADELNTVQSNVTARIRALEEGLGVQLFQRHSRGAKLTKAGLRLLPYAQKVHAVLGDARRVVRDDGIPNGRLTIGSLETTAATRLVPLLATYNATFPDVDIRLVVGGNNDLLRRAIDGEIDAAFVCGPVEHPELMTDLAFEEELVLATSATADCPSPVDYGSRILVKGPGCAYRDRLEQLLTSKGVFEFALLEFGTLDAIVRCVEAGLGLTLLPRSLLQKAADECRLKLHAVPDDIARVKTLFVRRRDLEFSALEALTAAVLCR